MNGGSITGLHSQPHHDGAYAEVASSDWPDDAMSDPEAAPRRWIAPTLAGIAVLAWVGGMLAFAAPMLATLDPVGWTSFIAALCVPPALIGIVWLLAMRTSHAEARRFAATAQSMRAEAAALERVVATVRRTLAESQADLRDQAETLLSLGDAATDRLRGVRAGMAEQVAAIGATTAMLDAAAETTEHRLATVLATLPRAHAETTDIARMLDATGLAASERVAALDAALSAVVQRGREADAVAGGAAQRLAAHIARMEATSESAGARLEAVIATMSGAVDDVLARAADAIDESRKAITAQGDATIAMVEANGAAIERAGREGAERLAERVRQIDAAVGALAGQLDDRRRDGEALLALLDGGLAGVDARFDRLRVTGVERAEAVAGSVAALARAADLVADALERGDTTAHRVIATAETALTALEAATRETDETLPGALDRLDARIEASRRGAAAVSPDLDALVAAADRTQAAIVNVAAMVATQQDTLTRVKQALLDTLDRGGDRIAAMRSGVDDAMTATVRFSEHAVPRMADAVARVRDAADAANSATRATLAEILPDTARRLEEDGAAALSRAVDRSVTQQLNDLTALADRATTAATTAADHLSRQLTTIADTGAEVEQRIAAARAEREAADADPFSRRVSLLIEAMHSAAIDIAGSLSTEVSDTAWAAYLKGDRGVFTRRAVRLIDSGQSRQIAALYDSDDGFRDQVNRYIHDFEAMLRHVLALRDGSPMSVTLLSSDIGKLYVVLAQAIERLRN